jgi:hypothetical protein
MRNWYTAARHTAFVAALLVASSVAPAPAGAAALPGLVGDRHGPLILSGSGELRWLGFAIYSASFWTTPETPAWPLDEPGTRALHITYRRSIRASRLLDATADEWQRLELADVGQVRSWSAELTRIWPDVQPGDTLTVVHRQGEAAWFYANGQVIGKIEDPRFGPAFLAIWLHPDSRDTRLRTALASGDVGP